MALMSASPKRNLVDLSQAQRRMAISLVLTALFVVFELAAGLVANSLALLTDAAHNFTDAIALSLSWWAMRLATKPGNARRTYGYHRAGILVALLNSTTLALISLGIFREAYLRLLDPPEVNAWMLTGVGLVAFVINLTTALLVRKGSQQDLNMRSAFLHLMGDVFSTLGAAIAGILMIYTGLKWLDPLVSALIGVLILWNAWKILRESVSILLESSPRDIDMQELLAGFHDIPGVLGVHDLHVWSLAKSLRALSAHVVVQDVAISQGAGVRDAINALLERDYGISHTTLQFECIDCEPNGLNCFASDLSLTGAPSSQIPGNSQS